MPRQILAAGRLSRKQPGGTSIRIAVVRATSLAAISVFPQTGNQLEVTGW